MHIRNLTKITLLMLFLGFRCAGAVPYERVQSEKDAHGNTISLFERKGINHFKFVIMDGKPRKTFSGETYDEIGSIYFVFYQYQNQGFIENVHVEEKWRNKGYGNVLFAQACEHLKKLGCVSLSLDVVKDNAFALAWYKRHEFVKDTKAEEDEDLFRLIKIYKE